VELQASHARPPVPVARPTVDVVVPFVGSGGALQELVDRLEAMRLRDGDRIFVADNRNPGAPPIVPRGDSVRLVAAPALRSSYHARNRGAAAGDAPWLLFLDADVEWSPELVDTYFAPMPDDRTAVVGGDIEDAPIAPGRRATFAERYAVARRTMAAANTLASPERPPYAQTANCLVRRSAFEAVGGFPDTVRRGGDADLCWQLLKTGWGIERHSSARVVHRNRTTLTGLLAQKARHGSGAAWLERRHRGTFPRRRVGGLLAWSARVGLATLRGQAVGQSGRAPAIVDVLAVWAFELGRLMPNGARIR
jgi:GT2 family glycosyltransferase